MHRSLSNTWTYSAHGLRLRSNVAIPGLVDSLEAASAEALPPDARLWLERVPPWIEPASEQACYTSSWLDEQGHPVLHVWSSETYYRFRYSDGVEFIVLRSGLEVWAHWPPASTLEDACTYLLGPILGLLLRLRNITCLHASAVAVGDRAMVLLGPAGAGKSTTAATFAAAGYPVVTDDIVAILERGDRYLVQPGSPRLRLWPKSVAALYGSAGALPLITPNWDKRYLDLTQNGYRFQSEPLPIACVYILGERRSDPAAPCIAAPLTNSLITLVANTYLNYFPLERSLRTGEFHLLSRFVRQVPVRHVSPHADAAYLPQMCQAILRDLTDLP